ncbi:protein HEG homolog 1 isoform X2 [Etheostoma cragini]|uniref:protein HEG homolog 1 isoform X2 n=1 Tax=Etheostoma cragini TaxID=417921 RepID=UPI00155F2F64|nr:protein HEG homolog 1 isoform X2 [Etheostoma cragini]
MFFSYLHVVCLLGAVVKGLTTDPFTLNSSSIISTNETTSQISTESRTTRAAVIGNSNFTHPTDSPSGPTSGTKMSTASAETTHPTNTMTRHTTLTQSPEPTSGNTTASTTTTPVSTTPTPTISTGTNITGTTRRPTDMTTNNSTTAAPTLPPFIVCPAASCPLESICLNGTCQCLSGSFLVKGNCVPAQVFPGQLHITSLTFDNEMSNRSSAIFQRTAAEISAALKDALKNHMGYQQSDVVQLEPGSVQATVNNIFEKTNATQDSVDQAIKQAIAAAPAGGFLTNATFTATNLCEQKQLSPCDISTTTCTNTNGRADCSCKKGYISNDYTHKICTACESGWRAVGNTCQPCAFGYAGFNCNDSALLAVVVISCVLGGVLLIIVLALLIFFCWRRCSKSKEDYNSSPYSSGDINQPWPTGITPIPRATSNSYEAPPIEMAEGGNNRVPVDKYQTNGLSGSYDLNPDTMHTFKGKNPSRYSYLVQGHENPYFLQGEDKRN